MKAVDILINSLLPSDLRDYKRPLDKKHLDSMLAECAQRYPDQTAGIIKKISDVGREASYAQGETITLDDMRSPIDKEAIFGEMDNELGRARSAFQGKDLVAAESNIYQKYSDRLTKETIDGALATGNNIGNSVISGARGNPSQLRGMLTTPAIYTDYKDKMIPMFVRHSFGEGLRPAEYLASTFGVRKSIISTKVGTAKGGALGKQFSQNTAHIVVSQHDCGTSNGLDMDVEDPDIKRRVLARDEGGVAAGTMIDRPVIGQLRKAGVSKVIVRSPLTCQAPEGICAECHGAMADYRMPKIGYVAGSTAGAAAAEPLAQGALNTKHTAGALGGVKKEFSGLDAIRNFTQTPETFPDRAAVAEEAGKVSDIKPAPQGGTFITVGDRQHYALPGFEPTVKVGDSVEQGDILSDGLADPHDIVRLRGLGEGRKYYMDRLSKMLEDSGTGHVNHLNAELITRGTLDNVRITNDEGLGNYLPDDVANYSAVMQNYSPPADTDMTELKRAEGKYLQQPVLHYTVGTQLTPKMLKHIGSLGFKHVATSATAPGFAPEMVRLQAAGYSGDDWMAKLNTSRLSDNLSRDASRARDANVDSSINFAPRLAKGEGFGDNINQTGKF